MTRYFENNLAIEKAQGPSSIPSFDLLRAPSKALPGCLPSARLGSFPFPVPRDRSCELVFCLSAIAGVSHWGLQRWRCGLAFKRDCYRTANFLDGFSCSFLDLEIHWGFMILLFLVPSHCFRALKHPNARFPSRYKARFFFD